MVSGIVIVDYFETDVLESLRYFKVIYYMYLYCNNVDALYQQAIDNGAESVVEPNDAFWGDRFCSILDPDNYEWALASVNGA
jgi:uncharacterized glyoxalase superfamily protein PhnB